MDVGHVDRAGNVVVVGRVALERMVDRPCLQGGE